MKISKREALAWFEFFAQMPGDEPLGPKQQEIAWAVIRQIEIAAEARRQALAEQIPNLKTQGGRTLYTGPDEKFPRGCLSCLMGRGLNAIRRTNRCNLRCRFCYDFGEMEEQPPVGEGYFEIGGTKYTEEDIELLLSVHRKPGGVAYVYLEPFLEIEKYYGIIEKLHRAGIHQHLYTNGTLANETNLRELGEAGLDELRFNLGATDCADAVIGNIGLAKQYIPSVGIETPMTEEFAEGFDRKKRQIFSTGLDFINCAELHLNPNNIGNYAGENLYMYRHGYSSPVWSRELTLRMMKTASEENWPFVVHDCSNRTKFARDMNLRSKEGGWFGDSAWSSEFEEIPFEAFLPVLEDPSFEFVEEREMPAGYRIGDAVY